MKIAIVLLRGINVSGQKSIKMAELKEHFENWGFTDVVTYIQSGNIKITTTLNDKKEIKTIIQQGIFKVYRFEVDLIVLWPEEIKKILEQSPFQKEENQKQPYFTFLFGTPEKDGVIKLEATEDQKDTIRLNTENAVVYISCPEGYGTTRFSNNFIEKTLSVPATTRNWNTVVKMLSLSEIEPA